MDSMIRLLVEEDLNQVFAIEQESDHDTWSEEIFEYALLNEEAYALISLDDYSLLGFLFGIETADEFNITNVAIKKSEQRKGLAYKLIKEIIDKKHHIASVFLEVRKSNAPAVNLYMKLGFEALYFRKAYYHNPIEDAIVMCLNKKKGLENV